MFDLDLCVWEHVHVMFILCLCSVFYFINLYVFVRSIICSGFIVIIIIIILILILIIIIILILILIILIRIIIIIVVVDIYIEPSSTSVFKVLIAILVFITKICTGSRFTQAYDKSCITRPGALLLIDATQSQQ